MASDRARTRTCWDRRGRLMVFALAASSIACLLSDFYGLCPMSFFAAFIFVPALLLLAVFAVLDRRRGDGRLWRAVWIGTVGGLVAAVAYDIFRLPFVFANDWGLEGIVAPMELFKVFPRFGAMVLGEPIEQPAYSSMAHIIGWLYHFSNGATFGVMYLALLGDARKRQWLWAVLFAMALELGMLLTPYPRAFNISVTTSFILVTLTAHAIFGAGLGLTVRWLSTRVQVPS